MPNASTKFEFRLIITCSQLSYDLYLSIQIQVVKASQGRVPVFLDGGVRRGTDVFKALALGASGIFVSIMLPMSP